MNNNDEETVSIIMPTYNSEKYISYSIKSVINQSYSKWELLVIDDGSNDETSNIIKKFQKVDTRIKYIRNEKNLGVSATRNRGIKLSRGTWIAFLDSDDIWEVQKLETQLNISHEKNVDFLFTGSSFIDENNKKYSGKLQVPSMVTYEKLKKHNVISCSSVLIKSEHFKTIKMENDAIHEDYAAWLQILKTGIKAYGIDEPLLIYRLSKHSKSGNKFKTFKMTFGVFRFIGLDNLSSTFYTFCHVLNSLKKYKDIGKKTVKVI